MADDDATDSQIDAPEMVTARNAHGTEVTVTAEDFKERYKPAGYKRIRIIEEPDDDEA